MGKLGAAGALAIALATMIVPFHMAFSNVASGQGLTGPLRSQVDLSNRDFIPITVADGLSASGAGGIPKLDLSIMQNNRDAYMAVDKSKAWDKIDFGSRRLTNNVWGAADGETLTSGVYLGQDAGFGWYWNRQEPKPKPGAAKAQPIYPSVRVGGSPWDPSNSVYFPVKIGDTKSLQLDVTYEFPTTPTGTYNLAYDMFFSDTNEPSSAAKPKAELMIWLRHTFAQPPTAYKGDFTDGNNTYELYSWVMSDGRLYYAFLLKEQCPLKAQHTVNAKRLMDHLNLDPGWFIHGVEFGSEVTEGSGKIEISQFNVTMNGANP